MRREQRAQVAKETLDILVAARYTTPAGHTVELGEITAAHHYTPELLDALLQRHAPQAVAAARPATSVLAEGVVDVILREALLHAPGELCILNFASAKNPGGGFLSGAQAQEESLARASSLYASLLTAMPMYEANRTNPSCLYSHHMVYSPRVVFFRDEQGALLDQPRIASIISAPAVNAGAVRRDEPQRTHLITPTMRDRLQRVLAIAAERRARTLILGAWGCGVFQNDPAVVAELFAQELGGHIGGCFQRVLFAIKDTSPGQEQLIAFHRAFPGKTKIHPD